MKSPETARRHLPGPWRAGLIVASVVVAKFIARAVFPADAHFLLRLFGGALIAGAVGAILLWGVVLPLLRRRETRPNE